jgi:tyrosinase
MMLPQLRTLIPAVLLLSSIPVTYAATCTNPAVRKEWRSLTKAERTDWIDAVKVLRLSVHFTLNPLMHT